MDRLADDLTAEGHDSWLDYRRLTPAQSWQSQIDKGVCEAEFFVLIVSRDSIASMNVTAEWKLALNAGKRIILALFEATPIPHQLAGCRWADFRSGYARGLRDFLNLLENSQIICPTIPQSGFKAPKKFYLSLALSALVVIGSFPTWWTLIVPIVVLPLPWRLYRRDYYFSRVFWILAILPLVYLATLAFFMEDGNLLSGFFNFGKAFWLPTTFASYGLLALLLTPEMQSRGLPQATKGRLTYPRISVETKSRSIAFAIDHAPEDGRCADTLHRSLEQHGHRTARADEKPEAVLVLISAYKTSSDFDPDEQPVYPVILQNTENIDPALKRPVLNYGGELQFYSIFTLSTLMLLSGIRWLARASDKSDRKTEKVR